MPPSPFYIYTQFLELDFRSGDTHTGGDLDRRSRSQKSEHCPRASGPQPPPSSRPRDNATELCSLVSAGGSAPVGRPSVLYGPPAPHRRPWGRIATLRLIVPPGSALQCGLEADTFACLRAIPLNSTLAGATLDVLSVSLENFGFSALYHDTGPPYSLSVDLAGEVRRARALLGAFKSDFDFQEHLQQVRCRACG